MDKNEIKKIEPEIKCESALLFTEMVQQIIQDLQNH